MPGVRGGRRRRGAAVAGADREARHRALNSQLNFYSSTIIRDLVVGQRGSRPYRSGGSRVCLGWKADIRHVSIRCMSKPYVLALLDREHHLLDRIFGEGQYEVKSNSPHEASVRSSRFKLELGYDGRDGSVTTSLTVSEPWGEELDIAEGWARFLGEEVPPLPRSATGQVMVSAEKQIRTQLACLARLSREVFSDPQKTRDAVHFVRGYRQAYNDWARGAWDPD